MALAPAAAMLVLSVLTPKRGELPLEANVSKRPEGSWLNSRTELEAVYDSLTDADPSASKWVHYFEIYERHLTRFRGQDVTICEVGVNMGGSLAAYRKYFGERATIIGVDVFNSSFMEDNPVYGRPRMFYGDQGSREFWRSFRQLVPRLDVLIDDGGHTAHLQVTTLEEMLPHLAPGGVLLTEDIIDVKAQKSIVRHVAAKYVTGEGGLYPFHFHAMLTQKRLTPAQQMLFSVSFYANVLVFEKLSTNRSLTRPIDHKSPITRTGERPKGTRMG